LTAPPPGWTTSYDVVVVGSGIAGLTVALHAADVGRVLVVTKDVLAAGSTRWAQGGIAAALGRISGAVTVAGISSDRLYPLRLQQELADLIPNAEKLTVIDSLDGHDGFLTEHEQVGALIRTALAN